MGGRGAELVGFVSCWLWRVDREERVKDDTQFSCLDNWAYNG